MTGFVARKHTVVTPLEVEQRHGMACVGYPPELWEVTGKHMTPENQVAQQICDRCPVRAWCYADALWHHDQGVIRGGRRFHDLRPHHKVAS